MQNSEFYLESSIMNPGVFIDIDGVLLKGGKPFEFTKEAIHTLWDNEIPFCFVTNGTYCTAVLTKNLSNILDLPLTTDHVVVAPSPCVAMNEYHDKRVLVCCQEGGIGLISELGFTNYITVPELVEIFPELDYVDHERRKELAKMQMTPELYKAQCEFKPIEAILLLGEPIKWEQALQVLIDVLMTNGDPRSKFKFVPNPHIPVIACNKDVTFKGPAPLPRFGHGAFLECLEALYLKITKNDLIYEEITGKPYIITYEFAANQIQALSKNGRINKFYMIGDNPEVDVRGANMFKEHLMMQEHKLSSRRSSARSSRRGSYANLSNMSSSSLSAEQARWNSRVESVLVCTGVYNPENDLLVYLRSLFNSQMVMPKDNNNFSTSSDETVSEETNSSSSSSAALVDSNNNSYCGGGGLQRNDSNVSIKAEELEELKNAMSRKNSFISYFDDKLNVPDVTVNTLKEAVEYIVKSIKANSSC